MTSWFLITSQKFFTKSFSKKVASSLITIQGGGHRLDPSYTRKFVLPFIDFHFHDRGIEITDLSIPSLNGENPKSRSLR